MKGIKKGSNKYLFLGLSVLLITIGLYFLVNSIPERSLKIEGEEHGAVKTITTENKKLTVETYTIKDSALKKALTNTNGFKLANGKNHTRHLYYYFKETTGGNYVYCIELGAQINAQGNPIAITSSYWKNMSSFQKEAIELIMVYGFPNKKRSGYSEELQFAATQMLIWEVQQGWRTSYSSVTPKTSTLANFVKKHAKLTEVYKSIITEVNNHKKIPSFSAATKTKISTTTIPYVNKTDSKYSVVLTDTNKVLSQFNISCPKGITCKISSNKLTIVAAKEISATDIKLTKKIPTGVSQSKILLDSTNSQKMILGVSKDLPAIVGYVRVDNENLGSIEIIKTSEDGVKKGFKFRVKGTNYDKTFTTDSNGKITIKDLKVGKYTITETNAPSKYVVNSAKTITLTNSKLNQTLKVYNELKTTSGVKVKKVDKDTNEFVAGVEMKLTLDNKVIETFVTTDKAYTIKQTLLYGKTYKICETKTPAGYVESKQCQSFTIKSAADLKTVNLTFKNEKTKMTIQKVDESNKMLAGATLQVYKADGKTKVGSSWDSGTKEHNIEGLTIGEQYILREEKAPEGYIKASDVKFTAKHNSVVTMKNILSTVEITKVDDNGNKISGAVLQVFEADGKSAVSEKWTTQADKVQTLTGLKVGQTYILKELEAPAGYHKSNDIKFVVLDKNPTKVIMKNIATEITITKMDAAGSKELAGAKLQIINSAGKVEHEWISIEGAPKVIKGLNYGETYTLREIIAPEGYALAEDVLFTVGVKSKVVMKDRLNEVLVYKKDEVTKEILKGAVLQLIDPDTEKVLKEWTSGDSPEKITGLTVGKSYIIREKSAPEKYLKSSDISFSLAATDVSKDVIVYNTPIIDIPNTAAELSVTSIVTGVILVLGGIGTILWIKKRNA